MDLPADPKRTAIAAIVAALIAAGLVLAGADATRAADQPAVDEYQLELPGDGDASTPAAPEAAAEEDAVAAGREQRGVVGEDAPAEAPLAAAGSAFGAAPAGVLLMLAGALAALIALVLCAPRHGESPR